MDNGGPAFPLDVNTFGPNTGMSLRDWFAGQALSGIAAKATTEAISELSEGIKAGRREAAAAYAWADAMLKERSK